MSQMLQNEPIIFQLVQMLQNMRENDKRKSDFRLRLHPVTRTNLLRNIQPRANVHGRAAAGQ